ncbi:MULTISPECIES: hypothetical protein [unclassified Paenibacillus]|uniref:hypothetical protein n=1 Tax=unclassified Paenibacillus TaxID=185978 RepID=UPI002405F6F5|nr:MULTISPECIES: hypothetical protein [unclassified Paenibacillus]MDF9841810.1 putative small lipoprotein YifL [Paenibacillus sp. PastF-2]MDF9848509.1 putative small lipoprotein YifL [Paenibacillus sp. PastM-2]MDF9854970.1 putative small lipoprotein YifL [Paenibacillus sp. PastF-1]MDH6480239.1 putative small lipoprotein YifL [Paenibacillus sp. PastH-2]MDH6507777.1 putative small lipoprotein YifL [Paenibacillus sp. PastM-3]
MRSQRSFPAAAAVAVLMLAITACGGRSPAEAPGEPSATVAPVQTETAAASPTPAPTAEPEQTIQGTGTYIGQIDNHSVEIETEEGPTAFELGAGTEDAPAALEMDDTVIIEYVEKPVEGDPAVVQRVLSRLEKADGGEASTEEGLPATKVIKLTLEGMEEEKTASLAEGDGYSLYVFDIFTFDQAAGRLAMKVDPGYYADITKLPSDFNLDALEEEGREALSAVGEVTKLSQEEQDRRMSGVRLYLTAMGSGLTDQYIVKEVDGQGYIIRLNIPQREASEGFGPHVYASLDSLVNR